MARPLSFIFWSETREFRQSPLSIAHGRAILSTPGREEKYREVRENTACVPITPEYAPLPTQHIFRGWEVGVDMKTEIPQYFLQLDLPHIDQTVQIILLRQEP